MGCRPVVPKRAAVCNLSHVAVVQPVLLVRSDDRNPPRAVCHRVVAGGGGGSGDLLRERGGGQQIELAALKPDPPRVAFAG